MSTNQTCETKLRMAKFLFSAWVIFSHLGSALYHDQTSEHIQIFRRLVWVESKGDPMAVSHKGAVGICQIMDAVRHDYNAFTGAQIGRRDLFNAQTNIRVGFWQYERLLRQFDGCYVEAVNSYNMGWSRTRSGFFYLPYLSAIVPDKTKEYFKGKTLRHHAGAIWKVTDHGNSNNKNYRDRLTGDRKAEPRPDRSGRL